MNRINRKLGNKGTVNIIAAIINAAAIIAAALISGYFAYLNVSARPFWEDVARENGWIPKRECSWHSVISSGVDSSGKAVQIRINILSQEYRWVFASATEVELAGEIQDLRPHLRSLDITESEGIVCVGTASVEGDEKEQEILARDRADKLISLVREELQPNIPVFGVNLGRFKNQPSVRVTPKETATQRRVILVEILKQDEGVILKEALSNALVKARQADPPIPFDIRDYLGFDLYQAKF